jgi:hypothetical protein
VQRNLLSDNVLALWAFVVGLFLCAVYDLFRVARLVKRPNTFVLFLSDLAFSLIAICSFLLLFFNLSFGKIRVYAILFSVLGFFLWRVTVSKVTVGLTLKLVKKAEKFLKTQKSRAVFLIIKTSRIIYTYHYCKNAVKSIKKLKLKEVKDATVKNDTN